MAGRGAERPGELTENELKSTLELNEVQRGHTLSVCKTVLDQTDDL